ncbi:ArsR/SmtB family transcription factor [Brevibacterium sp. VCM10]|uniref:ArsR/SmtB family transcription factor n=1 Tax=Brevibacterium sp. VCM10 TaxID=1381751 RepID=UPI000471F615|nr:metalloregulator ArsR/SmtB family transcription factor [Brevibacterium sp. VCM10]
MNADTKKCTFDPESQYADLAAEVFTLLSDATRVRIILALRDGEKSVNDLAEAVGKSPTVVSQHLAKLRWGKIVAARPEGNRSFYSLIDEHARELVAHAVFQAQHVVSGAPAHHCEADGTITAESGQENAESGQENTDDRNRG